jgi:hypothetical protein
MSRAFILGNGISRKGVSGSWLKNYGLVYGCNAIYREFTPDVLVATDKPIATHIQSTGYANENRFHTRKPIEGSGALELVPAFYKFSSGPNAIGLAVNDRHKDIYMLGFDMGPTLTNKFNNMYAGTEFYKTEDAGPTFSGNWVKQIVKIIRDYPDVNFYRVFGDTTADIEDFDRLKNLVNLDLNSFIDRINNEKDS